MWLHNKRNLHREKIMQLSFYFDEIHTERNDKFTFSVLIVFLIQYPMPSNCALFSSTQKSSVTYPMARRGIQFEIH